MKTYPLVIILGPTASGKTRLAVQVAASLGTDVISADSRQIFNGMDIGTGKDLNEYRRLDVAYHLIDILPAGEKYNVDRFKSDFFEAFISLTAQKKMPILCGGTGMYIHSLLQDSPLTAVPENAELRRKLMNEEKKVLVDILRQHPDTYTLHADTSTTKRLIRAIEIAAYLSDHVLENVERPKLSPLVIGIKDELLIRRAKIIDRLQKRLDEGLIEEVKKLLASGVSSEMMAFYGLEYKFVTAHINGEISFHQLKEKLSVAICQFAKRQMTFFRKMEKDGVKIHWLNADTDFSVLKSKALSLISEFAAANPLSD